MGGPNVRQLLKNRHHSAPSGEEPDRRWDAPIRRGGMQEHGGGRQQALHEEDTALETCPRRVAGAGGVSHPVAF